eukprot:scaffold58694_cov72-Cyclotella_meneghiniana.AAC.11
MSLVPFTPSKQSKKSNSSRSPFLVDLVAESERIDEEYKVRVRSIERKQKLAEARKEQAKNDIIIRALSEPNELEILRKEKVKILEEEKRLRALIELEKTNSHRKNDRQAAVLAEKRRHAAKLEKRRNENKEKIAEREEARKKMLQIKHNLNDSSRLRR